MGLFRGFEVEVSVVDRRSNPFQQRWMFCHVAGGRQIRGLRYGDVGLHGRQAFPYTFLGTDDAVEISRSGRIYISQGSSTGGGSSDLCTLELTFQPPLKKNSGQKHMDNATIFHH